MDSQCHKRKCFIRLDIQVANGALAMDFNIGLTLTFFGRTFLNTFHFE